MPKSPWATFSPARIHTYSKPPRVCQNLCHFPSSVQLGRNASTAATRKSPKSKHLPQASRPSHTAKAHSGGGGTWEVVSEETKALSQFEPDYSGNLNHPDIKLDLLRPIPSQDLTSTRPAPLETPDTPRSSSQDTAIPLKARAKYFYALGKAYLGFYKTGLKNVWNNYKEYRKIRERLIGCSISDAAWYGGQTVNGIRFPTITRREYQLYIRSRHDIGKLLPFGLVFLICGEFTPLVILAIGSSVVPFTCRIPKQIEYDRRKFFENEKNSKYQTKLGEAEDQIERLKSGEIYKNWYFPWSRDLEINQRTSTVTAYRLGLAPLIRPIPLLGTPYGLLWAGRRIRKWGTEDLSDLILIRREGGFRALEPIEILECAQKWKFPPWLNIQREALAKTGKLDWNTHHAEQLIPMLENYSDVVLGQDWTKLPVKERHSVPYKAIIDWS